MPGRYPPSTNEAITLNGLVERAHEASVAAGWWDEALPCAPPDRTAAPRVTPTIAGAKLALVHSEVSEALECVRSNQIYGFRDPDTDKPDGLPFELADAVIRIADLAGAYGIDLDAAVREKMAFNATRGHRHGGKAL